MGLPSRSDFVSVIAGSTGVWAVSGAIAPLQIFTSPVTVLNNLPDRDAIDRFRRPAAATDLKGEQFTLCWYVTVA
ncbi:hypothetical protein IQ254_20260 [Nodosilinea sp. LEGE 07088]|uniref:hypothetical protein n=1 Tax=Nodosilinea sp. LEGE 07088 TaxID=2777968 RepID=UPI00187F3E76|nr:hypothetical protein [Nodosilinea sp. LEGE 07088]MBE9139501.1 hypothetical protein [Nodosilinea sp. LEGE 07088]